MNVASSRLCFCFLVEQDTGDSGGEAKEMMNLLIACSLLMEGVAGLSVLICTHWEGDTVCLGPVLC